MAQSQSSDSDIKSIADDMAHALSLLRAGHGLYDEILRAISKTVPTDGEADIPELLRRVNVALTQYAPRDREALRLLERYD